MHVKRGCSICARLTKVCHRIRHAIRHHRNTLWFKCISYHVTDVTDVTVYFLFYMRIAYYPRDCTNSITMLLKELQGCKVNSAIILLVGARFARPKIVYVAYYSQDRDRWFGQASPTTVKLRKTSTVKHILMPHQVLPTDICPTAILVPWRIWKGHRFHSCTK